MKRAFTLVELLVVIGMIAVLMGAMGSGVANARKRANIARATQEVKEMTNAILAYENYAPGRTLAKVATEGGEWVPATEDKLGMILGKAETEGNGKLPVLYNAHISFGGEIRDPWGKPYMFIIKRSTGAIQQKTASGFVTAPSLPNFYRLSDEERQ